MYLQYNTLQTGKTLHILVYERIYYLVVLNRYIRCTFLSGPFFGDCYLLMKLIAPNIGWTKPCRDSSHQKDHVSRAPDHTYVELGHPGDVDNQAVSPILFVSLHPRS